MQLQPLRYNTLNLFATLNFNTLTLSDAVPSVNVNVLTLGVTVATVSVNILTLSVAVATVRS